MAQNQTGSTEQRLALNVCYGIIGTLGIAILCRDLGVGPSGPNLTFRFSCGFPCGLGHASLGNARKNPEQTERVMAPRPCSLPSTCVSLVQRIWRAHGLQPHRMRQFKLSNDPQFVAKLRDIVGLYVNPPDHAVVLSVDEKSQIQARDRTQPGLPMKKGRAATITHDYKRHGTTTLFAAFDVLEGKVIGQCMKRHRHQEFIRFLNLIDARVPTPLIVHVIVDNYAAHKHPKVLEWLARHPRFVFHFTPTSASWLNAVEGLFALLAKRRLKRGVFRSLKELTDAIHSFIADTNANPKPFIWTKDPGKIIAAVKRGHQVLDSIH